MLVNRISGGQLITREPLRKEGTVRRISSIKDKVWYRKDDVENG